MQNYRIQTIDLIKIIAMLCVMGLHCAGVFVFQDTETLCGNIVYRISVCAIPLFFMVSGYLLLGRKNADYKYSYKKCISIVKFVAICSIGYTLLFWLKCYWKSIPIDYFDLIRNFVGAFIQRGPISIFWYFGAMIIVYLMYPLLNQIYINHSKSFVGIALTLLFVESIIYTQSITHNALNINILTRGGVFESSVIQTFRIWNWIFYFMLGGILRRQAVIVYIKSYFKIGTVVFLCVLNVILQMLLLPALGKLQCEYFYCSFFVIAYSASIFININSRYLGYSKLIAEISNLFLPVYAFHIFVIAAFSKFESIWINIGFLAPFIFWIAVSAVTITLSYFFMKIPFAKKLFTI